MTTRSQKKKAVAELFSGDFEASVAKNISSENLVAGPSKTVRVEPENFNEKKHLSEKKSCLILQKY